MFPFPEPPQVPAAQCADGRMVLRYEDVAQDGRLMLAALPTGLSVTVWSRLLTEHPATHVLREQGIVPILTRLVLEAGAGPHSFEHPLELVGCYEMAHARTASGEVDRILVDTWLHARAPLARVYGPPPDDAVTVVEAGRLHAEHVLTRLFADPGQRKVQSVEAPGMAGVPARQRTWVPPRATLDPPPEAAVHEPGLVLDPSTTVFGLMHTDSNQHVNSLVYPRLFEEAALRRLDMLGLRGGLARFAESAYRKPCFAGERVRVVLRTFLFPDGTLGAAGAFVSEVDADAAAAGDAAALARAHAFVRVRFEA